jgi:hypothetical protein
VHGYSSPVNGLPLEPDPSDPDASRTEYGSDPHWVDLELEPKPGAAAEVPWTSGAPLFGSGRDAMRVLVDWGMREQGWRRIWLPSYYCQEMPAALRELTPRGLTLCAYPDGPDDPEPAIGAISVRPGDVVLVANQLGTRRPPAALDDLTQRAVVVEDHSHDLAAPWAMRSQAHYAIASLRKTLPLPDGGVAWSPRGLPLPPEPELTEEHASAAFARLTAMILKARYLAGEPISKAAFLAEARSGADRIAEGPASGIATVSRELLPTLPISAWRRRRRRNFRTLLEALGPLDPTRVLEPPPGGAPYALTFVMDTRDRRERVRQGLIAADVYPAILWSLDEPAVEGIPAEHVQLARRMLSVHCDQRYGDADMVRVAEIAKPLLAG